MTALREQNGRAPVVAPAEPRFTRAQVVQLLKPINPSRVLRDGKGHSHVSQQDVTAHLIRMFGFGGFDVEIDGPHLVFEQERTDHKTGKPNGRWDVCYRAKATLLIKAHGEVICRYDGSATGVAENQKRGDGHDLALKSAESVAKKRAATNLGDQFGLSLYNKGQLEALVRGTLVLPADGEADDEADIQQGVPQQVSLGNDEIERDDTAPAFTEQTRPPAPGGHADPVWVDGMKARIKAATGRPALTALAREISEYRKSGRCDAKTEAELWLLGTQRQELLDSIPRNQDGSVSRSRATDEQLAAIGAMTKEQLAEHSALVRSGSPNPGDIEHVTTRDPADPWAQGVPTDYECLCGVRGQHFEDECPSSPVPPREG